MRCSKNNSHQAPRSYLMGRRVGPSGRLECYTGRFVTATGQPTANMIEMSLTGRPDGSSAT